MRKTLQHFLLLTSLIITFKSYTQLNYGGQPYHWERHEASHTIPEVSFAVPDRNALAAQDAEVDRVKTAAYRFGVEYDASITPSNDGTWIIDNEIGMAIWQVTIDCPQALSISMRFDEFEIPKDAKVFVWNLDRTNFLGGFDKRNVNQNGQFAVGLLFGDKAIVELMVPIEKQNQVRLKIGQVVYGYRNFLGSAFRVEGAERGPFGSAGGCEVNVNCPEGAEWQTEKKAVAIIVEGGFGVCSGALVNNTAMDGTPYFLTANHCTSGATVANWIFYFNHESASCTGNTGPTNQSISGSSLVANNAASDFALLLLNNTPPASFDVQYAGWDHSDDPASVTSAVGIHHPAGDVKKISFENNAPYHAVGNNAQVWWIDNWELGVTEPGSSGSPLFNQNHRIIGQLFGGNSACSGNVGNGQYDFYGRFGVSWNNSANSNARLIDWLDPLGSGLLALDGYPNGTATPPTLDAAVGNVSGLASTVCSSTISPVVMLYNYGTDALNNATIQFSLNGGTLQTYNWTGALDHLASVAVSLPSLNVVNGANSLLISIANINGQNDTIVSNNTTTFDFNAITGVTFGASVNITFDNYPDETSWDIRDVNGSVLWSSNGNYAGLTGSVDIPVCLPSGCYTFTIYDSYGDGICCGFFNGNGSYSVTNAAGDQLAFGAQFTFNEATQICLGAADIPQINKGNVNVYPNPAADQLQIASDQVIDNIEILDCSGRVVKRWNNLKRTSTSTDINGLPEGVYMARIMQAGNSIVHRIVVQR